MDWRKELSLQKKTEQAPIQDTNFFQKPSSSGENLFQSIEGKKENRKDFETLGVIGVSLLGLLMLIMPHSMPRIGDTYILGVDFDFWWILVHIMMLPALVVVPSIILNLRGRNPFNNFLSTLIPDKKFYGSKLFKACLVMAFSGFIGSNLLFNTNSTMHSNEGWRILEAQNKDFRDPILRKKLQEELLLKKRTWGQMPDHIQDMPDNLPQLPKLSEATSESVTKNTELKTLPPLPPFPDISLPKTFLNTTLPKDLTSEELNNYNRFQELEKEFFLNNLKKHYQ